MVTHSEKGLIWIVSAVPVHIAVSLWWAVLLAHALPRRRRVLIGGLAGAAIAMFDVRVVGRRFPRIHALPLGPQIADHVAFGAVVAALTKRPN